MQRRLGGGTCFRRSIVGRVMIILAFAAIAAQHVITPNAALDLCRPALARKAGGDIATIDVGSSKPKNAGLTIKGWLTAFQGMGPPQPGSASAHHLIRSDFDFTCRIERGRVSRATVSPKQ